MVNNRTGCLKTDVLTHRSNIVTESSAPIHIGGVMSK
jgi:hypothetical protein